MAGLLFSLFRRKNINFTLWVGLGIWLFLSASATMAVGFFADSIGLTRHTMFAVEMFRLMMWVFLIVLFDQSNRKDEFQIS
jgi:ABC-type polysaccharide/polyol phosphate export permease